MIKFLERKIDNIIIDRFNKINNISHCEIIWNKKSPKEFLLFGVNNSDNSRKYICDLYTNELKYYNLNNFELKKYIPKVLLYIDWKIILMNIGKNIKRIKFKFMNYLYSDRLYILHIEITYKGLINKKKDFIIYSTNKNFLNGYNLMNKIKDIFLNKKLFSYNIIMNGFD